MTRKHRDDDYDDRMFKIDGTLEQRVKSWAKYAEFRHLTGPQCPKCHKTTYLFKPEDEEGFCVDCFNKRWPHPVNSSAPKKEDKTAGMKLE